MLALEQDVQHKLAQLRLLEAQNQELRARAQALELAVASSSTAMALAQLPWVQREQQAAAAPPSPAAPPEAPGSCTPPAPSPKALDPPAGQPPSPPPPASQLGAGVISAQPPGPSSGIHPGLGLSIGSGLGELLQSYRSFIASLSQLLLEHDAAAPAGEGSAGGVRAAGALLLPRYPVHQAR
jgi:hypothetical protein